MQVQRDYCIAPSILSADFARLGEEVDAVLAAGADMIHFDVMDMHFVPNLSIGPLVCESLRKNGLKADIDVHLMVQPVDALISLFADAGASYITFHPEASENVEASLKLIRDKGCKPGLVLNPGSELAEVKHLVEQIDILLLMSVNPGFGGQAFIPETLGKLQAARKMLDQHNTGCRLEVDGGINLETLEAAAEAGADTFVAGSAIFGAADYRSVIAAMRDKLGPR